jgi:hypothetical protein
VRLAEAVDHVVIQHGGVYLVGSVFKLDVYPQPVFGKISEHIVVVMRPVNMSPRMRIPQMGSQATTALGLIHV